MPTIVPPELIPIITHLNPGEEIFFVKQVSRFLGGNDSWILTNQRLFKAGKRGLEEIPLLVPGEVTKYHDTGEVHFSGNVHLLTNQRVIVLDVGKSTYILESVPLSKITAVDIQAIRDGWTNSIFYGIKINVDNRDEPILIKHGGITTRGIDQQELDLYQRQKINERFPRKICELTGLKFAIPEKRVVVRGATVISFYSKSDLVWPERCSACNENAFGLVYDEYTVINPWLLANYSFGPGIIPEFTYRFPYCSECYRERFQLKLIKRAIKESWAKSDGARVELSFENPLYAAEFIDANSR